MRKIAAWCVLALAVSACASDPVVASVNDVDIRQSDVLELRAVADDVATVPGGDFRNELFNLIAQEVLATALESEFGIVIGPDEIEAELQVRLAATNATEEEAIAALQTPGATRERLLRIVYSGLLGSRAVDALGRRPGFVSEVLDDTPELITTVCARHILAAGRPEAEEVMRRLDAGEDFSAVAAELSLDPAAGGDLGCNVAGSYVPEFAAATLVAPIGEFFGPVETDFGFHVLIVDERSAPSVDDVLEDPQTALPPTLLQSEFTSWFNDVVREADVSVLSRVGTWFPEGPGILPPG